MTSAGFTVLAHAPAGVKAFFNPPRADMRTYVNGSKIGMLAVVLALTIVPDGFLLWMLVPHSLWWLAPVLDVTDVWACVWAFGVYGSMVALPHEVHGDRIVLHNGALQRTEIDPKDVCEARVLGLLRRRELPRRPGDGSKVLTFGGVPVVELVLRDGQKIFVGSDAPQHLCTALLADRVVH